MEYLKIRADFVHAEKGRFYRTFLVRKDCSLTEFGCAMVTLLKGEFEHCFYFEVGRDLQFSPASFMEDSFWDDVYLGEHFLDELGEKFTFCYDSGEGWDFACKVYKKVVEMESENSLILLEGAGAGIMEDNIGTLYAYLDGEIPKDFKEDEEKGYYLPWNLDFITIGDFDNPLDIGVENELFEERAPIDLKIYVRNERAYIRECGLDFKVKLKKPKKKVEKVLEGKGIKYA